MAKDRSMKGSGAQRIEPASETDLPPGSSPDLHGDDGAGDDGADVKLDVQQFSGIVFFAALQYYKNKDTAMAFAICLEAALYWRYDAKPEERASHEAQTASHRKQARPDSGAKRKPSSDLLTSSAQATQRVIHLVAQRQRAKLEHYLARMPGKLPLASAKTNGTRKAAAKRQRVTPAATEENASKEAKKGVEHSSDSEPTSSLEVFKPAELKPNMAVLLRTEADDSGSWTKCWSLGRVLKISTKRTISVCWLKPAAGSTLPADKIFAQKWVPWTFKQGKETKRWTSDNLGLASVQYGTDLAADGVFPEDVQKTLAAEVKRLEASVAKQEKDNARSGRSRKAK